MDNSQRRDLKAIRDAAILTTGYVAGTVLHDVEPYNQLQLAVLYTKGSLTSLQIKIEFSIDGTNYVQETSMAVSTGTSTGTPTVHHFAPAGNQNYLLEIPIACSMIKVSAKGTGTVTSSSLTLNAVLAVV